MSLHDSSNITWTNIWPRIFHWIKFFISPLHTSKSCCISSVTYRLIKPGLHSQFICSCFFFFKLRAVVYMASILHWILETLLAGAALAHVRPVIIHLLLDQSPYTCVTVRIVLEVPRSTYLKMPSEHYSKTMIILSYCSVNTLKMKMFFLPKSTQRHLWKISKIVNFTCSVLH